MSTADGSITSTTKIVDHGPDARRYNIVILGDGYQATEMTKYHNDVQNFVDTLQVTPPYDDLWCAINVHRVDVVSTDSGADDPSSCGDGSSGSGASPSTYFDSTFCGGGSIRRSLTCDSSSAENTAVAQVPQVHMTMVIVNTPIYGGTGGQVATFSTASSAAEIGLHEMGHTAFNFADEYESYAGCGSGETGHDHYPGGEPGELNVTINTDVNTIKWHGELTSPADGLPTTTNADCTKCDSQANPKAADYVGAYEGARYYHCGCYRPSYNCRMRVLGVPFCAVCQRIIRDDMASYMPAPVSLTWPPPLPITYGTLLGTNQLDATAPVPGTFDYTPPIGTLLTVGTYTLNVRFTPTDFADFCFARASVPLTVVKATPTILWPPPQDIVYGTPLPVQATAATVSPPVPGTFVYNPPANTCPLPAGSNLLSVTFTPADLNNFNSATGSQTIHVLKATPNLTWQPPPDIDVGDPLTAAAYSVQASFNVCGTDVQVPGTFTFAPTIGTLLPAGTHTLTAFFMPSDTGNYNPVTATAQIHVLTGRPVVQSVTFSPTVIPLDIADPVLTVTVTIKNDSIHPHTTQGPDPGFEYSEGDTYQTKGFPSIAGAYRVAVDLDETTYLVPYLYRWGFGQTLAPGASVQMIGCIRFHNTRHNGHYYVAMIQEVDNVVQDQQGKTMITVVDSRD